MLYQRGRLEEADHFAARAEAEAAADNIAPQVVWRGVRAKLEQSVAIAREAVTLADRTDQLNLRADAQLNLAETLQLTGDSSEASRALQRALELCEQKGNVVAAARVSSLLSTAVS